MRSAGLTFGLLVLRFRFKYVSEKRFETLRGVMGVARRVYQNASDTKSHVPLDATWGMADQFMTIEVREAVAFSCALVTPEETHALLKKSALFHPHPTQIKRCVEGLGALIAVDPLALDARVRSEEQAPEETRVLAASPDGANVLLNEPAEQGAKRGRPAERPGVGEGSSQGRAWYDKYRKKLLEEDLGARSVLHSMDYYEQTSALPKSRREALAAQRTFFRRNQARMTYAGFRRRGLPIGSGPVEAACKTLVKTRRCRNGMRWSRKGGQRILDLRTYVKSNRWDPFRNEYKNRLLAA